MFRLPASKSQGKPNLRPAKTPTAIEPLEHRQLLAATDLLVGSVANASGPIVTGGTIKVTRTYQISGSASPTCYLMYRFSTNRIWGDDDDIVFTSKELLNTTAARSQGTHIATVSLTTPPVTKAGSYYLLAKVDGSNMVTESSERNNVLACLVSVSTNDAFANRIPISGLSASVSGLSASVSGINEDATVQPGEPNHGGFTGGKSVWWAWTPSAWGKVTIDTIGSNFDTLLSVYTGAHFSGLLRVARNHNISTTDLASSVTFTAMGGQTYQIAVDGYRGAAGSIKLNLREILFYPTPPTSVTASMTYADKVVISWKPTATAAEYEVWRTTTNTIGGAIKISPAGLTGTTFSDTTAVVGTRYWYWLKSRSNGLVGTVSASAQGMRVSAFSRSLLLASRPRAGEIR